MNKNPNTLSDLQRSVLIGSLLGDGCLHTVKTNKSPTLFIRRQPLDLPYLKWQFSVFKNLCGGNSIRKGKQFHKEQNKEYEYCCFETRSIPAFKSFYDDWYPNGTKIVPRNFDLDPIIIAIWICDDAHIRKVGNALSIKFCTNGFIKEDTLYLKSLLDKRYNTNFTIQEAKKSQYVIMAHDYQSRLILKDIDSSFPASMSRKSSVWSGIDLNKVISKPNQKTSLNNKLKLFKFLMANDSFTRPDICQSIGYLNKDGKPNSNMYLYLEPLIKDGTISESKIIELNKEIYFYKVINRNKLPLKIQNIEEKLQEVY